ncbi:MAG TPA: hypothetical protein DER04_05110, partial [Holosporales bacterium]|nr:hypothetical protein [Holosporales bacterium]HBW24188.1 hypothetical protein [Holosporales bacterium]HCC24645.1 hypothetical protein [Holosporales bacterium]HCE96127.1 hypothetical protein [Holosporales bacterium]
MTTKKAIGFLTIALILSLVKSQAGLAWANCIINKTNEITEKGPGERVYIVGYFGSPGFFADYKFLTNNGDWTCTKEKTINVSPLKVR